MERGGGEMEDGMERGGEGEGREGGTERETIKLVYKSYTLHVNCLSTWHTCTNTQPILSTYVQQSTTVQNILSRRFGTISSKLHACTCMDIYR